MLCSMPVKLSTHWAQWSRLDRHGWLLDEFRRWAVVEQNQILDTVDMNEQHCGMRVSSLAWPGNFGPAKAGLSPKTKYILHGRSRIRKLLRATRA
jgi:hypothetical protein